MESGPPARATPLPHSRACAAIEAIFIHLSLNRTYTTDGMRALSGRLRRATRGPEIAAAGPGAECNPGGVGAQRGENARGGGAAADAAASAVDGGRQRRDSAGRGGAGFEGGLGRALADEREALVARRPPPRGELLVDEGAEDGEADAEEVEECSRECDGDVPELSLDSMPELHYDEVP